MNVGELIKELEKLPQDMPVCGQSETSTWDIEAEDIAPSRVVKVDYSSKRYYPTALILGYHHG